MTSTIMETQTELQLNASTSRMWMLRLYSGTGALLVESPMRVVSDQGSRVELEGQTVQGIGRGWLHHSLLWNACGEEVGRSRIVPAPPVGALPETPNTLYWRCDLEIRGPESTINVGTLTVIYGYEPPAPARRWSFF